VLTLIFCMSSSGDFREVLPKRGLLFTEAQAQLVLCKPKLLPLKSLTLQRLEEMHAEARMKAKKQMEEQERQEMEEAPTANIEQVVSESVSFE